MKLYREGDFLVWEADKKRRVHFLSLELMDHEDGTVSLFLNVFNGSNLSERHPVNEILDEDGNPYGTTVHELAIGLSSGIDVNIQDSTSPPVDSYFLNRLGSFSLAADTIESGVEPTDLEYDITAATGHGIVAGDEILLLDVLEDRDFYAHVISVSGDVITVDRPIDHAYHAAHTLGRIVVSNMAVDGSVTPVIYTMRGGLVPLDIVRMLITMLSATAMDDGKFGSLPALERGLVLRGIFKRQKTIFNFKTNLDIKQFCYDVKYADKAPAGQYGLSSRITFGGQHTHGMVYRLTNEYRLQWIVQDDLLGLVHLKIAGEGSLTSGEV